MTNEEAIFIINNRLNTYYCTDEDLEALNKAIEVLKNERPKGEWIKIEPEPRGYAEFFRCSNCLTNVQLSYWDKECEYNYCPNCGADMRGGG